MAEDDTELEKVLEDDERVRLIVEVTEVMVTVDMYVELTVLVIAGDIPAVEIVVLETRATEELDELVLLAVKLVVVTVVESELDKVLVPDEVVRLLDTEEVRTVFVESEEVPDATEELKLLGKPIDKVELDVLELCVVEF